jgi:hypothetical protein
MTVTRALLLRGKKIEKYAQVQQVSSVHYLNLQKKLLSKSCCLRHELTLLKSPIRNVDWLGLCELRNLKKIDYFEGP